MSFFSSPPINLARRHQGALAARVGADLPVVVECPKPGFGAVSVIVGAAVIGAAAYYIGKSNNKVNSFLIADRDRLLEQKRRSEERIEYLRDDREYWTNEVARLEGYRVDLQLARALDRIPSVVISDSKKAEMMREAYEESPITPDMPSLARSPQTLRDSALSSRMRRARQMGLVPGTLEGVVRAQRQAKKDAFFAGEGPSPGPDSWPDSPYIEEE